MALAMLRHLSCFWGVWISGMDGLTCACCHACRIDRVTFVTRPVLQI